MEDLYNYITTEIKKIFDLEAQKQGVKSQSSNKNGVFGARVKIPGKEVEIAVVSTDISVLFYLSAGSHSFKDDYCEECRTRLSFDAKITKIEDFVKDCFALKLIKKF
jgi:hypothetical protein